MANFTTRVELHRATDEDYSDLHEAMEADGFSRTITGSDGVEYHLPPAEYNFKHNSMTASEVRDKAYAVANTIKTNSAVIVTQGTRSWNGLKRV